MISRRIIPFFLLKGSRLVKGTQFKNFFDVGDPLSQAMIYDAQGADEIIIVDIQASKEKGLIDTEIINRMIKKCRLPITAGGGIRSLSDAWQCFKAGADKIVLNTHAILDPRLVKKLADEFGSQSIVVSIDVKKGKNNDYDVYVYSGTEKVKQGLEGLIKQLIGYGMGELIITSIDREGTLSSFDCKLYQKIQKIVPVPFIASGGASSYDDMVMLFQKTNCDACAIGKMLFLRDYDIVRIKAYLKGRNILTREA